MTRLNACRLGCRIFLSADHPDWTFCHRASECIIPLGIMGAQLSAPLNRPVYNNAVKYDGVSGALHLAPTNQGASARLIVIHTIIFFWILFIWTKIEEESIRARSSGVAVWRGTVLWREILWRASLILIVLVNISAFQTWTNLVSEFLYSEQVQNIKKTLRKRRLSILVLAENVSCNASYRKLMDFDG